MDPKVEALAARLKTVLDEAESGRRHASEARERERAEARAARSGLLEQLATFGRAVGHLKVDEQVDRLVLSWGGQHVAFVPHGDADGVKVVLGSLEGAVNASTSPVRIYRGAGGVWVLAVLHDGVEDTEPLIDRGLVHLLIEGLGVPLPRPEPARQPPLDDLVPGE